MEGSFTEGHYVTPNGESVHVFRGYGATWCCTITVPGSGRVTAQELTTSFWRTLRRADETSVPGGAE